MGNNRSADDIRSSDNPRSRQDPVGPLFREIYDGAALPTALLETGFGEFVACNTAAVAVLGFDTPDEIIGRSLAQLVSDGGPDGVASSVVVKRLLDALRREGAVAVELSLQRPDDTIWDADSRLFVFPNAGRPLALLTLVDISERKQAEAARDKLRTGLLQSQKMEAIGRLAGGVAHDFNNMLGVIIGQTEMIRSQEAGNVTLAKSLGNIESAAERCIDLTQQLLAFARKQTAVPQVLDVNERVGTMVQTLRHLIREEIHIAWRPETGVGKVRIDPTQLEQLLGNLCVNAEEAIRGSGRIVIETANTIVTDGAVQGQSDAAPGEYVVISVTDNGDGMPPEVQQRVFEPFFSTKALKERGGLGLATVYGIVQQNDGFIQVESEPRKGSTFRIHLRRLDTSVIELRSPSTPQKGQASIKNILLVEDEQTLLELYEHMLQQLGFNVLAASSPGEALRLAESEVGAIDLLITDVVMPEMNGRDLYARIITTRPHLKCLYISGYTADVISNRGVLDAGLHFLQKPFTLNALSEKLQELSLVAKR